MKRATKALPLAILMMCALSGSALANQMLLGETGIGQMAGPGSVHEIYVDLAEGERVVLKVTARGSGAYAPATEVLGPDGEPVATFGGRRSLKGILVAEETGTYRIELTADAQSSDQFSISLEGSRSREYVATGDRIEFSAVAGSVLSVRVKAKNGRAVLANPVDDDGQDVPMAILREGRKLVARSGPLARTAKLSMSFGPAGSQARVKVRAPKSRGTVALGPAAPPAAPNPGGGNGDDGTTGSPAPAPAPTPAPSPAPAPAPAPPPAGDPEEPRDEAEPERHAYLVAALLKGEREDDVARAVEVARESAHDAAAIALERMRAEAGDALLEKMQRVLSDEGLEDQPLEERGIDRVGKALDEQRRCERARQRLELIREEAAGSALAGEKAFEDAAQSAADEIDDRLKALDAAIEQDLRRFLFRKRHAFAESLGAPDAPKDEQARADMQQLDEEVLAARIEERAQNEEEIAVDTMIAFYGTWLAMLDGVDNDHGKAERVRNILDEMAQILAEMRKPREPRAMVMRAFGAEGQMEVEFQAGDAEANQTEEGLELSAHEDQPIVVSWDAAGSRGSLEINLRKEEEGDLIDLVIRAGDHHDQSAVEFDLGNEELILAKSATPDGLRLTVEARPDGIITVLWNLEEREGGFELRVTAVP